MEYNSPIKNEKYKCIFCGVMLDDSNKTKEHVFLEAMGDNLTSENIICNNCNNIAGDKIDGPFVNQLKNLTNFYQIKGKSKDTRIKGKTEDGLEYYVDFYKKSSPKLVHPDVNYDGKVFSITGDSVSEVKSIFKKFYKRHHLDDSKIDFDSLITVEKDKHPRLNFDLGPIDLNIFSIELIKMAVEYATLVKMNPIMFNQSLNTLQILINHPQIIVSDLYKLSYDLIEAVSINHIQNGIAPKIINNDRSMKAILYMYQKQLYCEISVLGTFNFVVPLISFLDVNNYKVTIGDNKVISSHNIENTDYLKGYKFSEN